MHSKLSLISQIYEHRKVYRVSKIYQVNKIQPFKPIPNKEYFDSVEYSAELGMQPELIHLECSFWGHLK